MISELLIYFQNTAHKHVIIMEGRVQVTMLSGTHVYAARRSSVSVMCVVWKSDSISFNSSHFVEWEQNTSVRPPPKQQQQKTNPQKTNKCRAKMTFHTQPQQS